jgi:hypothetical protein
MAAVLSMLKASKQAYRIDQQQEQQQLAEG